MCARDFQSRLRARWAGQSGGSNEVAGGGIKPKSAAKMNEYRYRKAMDDYTDEQHAPPVPASAGMCSVAIVKDGREIYSLVCEDWELVLRAMRTVADNPVVSGQVEYVPAKRGKWRDRLSINVYHFGRERQPSRVGGCLFAAQWPIMSATSPRRNAHDTSPARYGIPGQRP